MLQKKRKFDTTAFLFIAPAFILFTVFLIVPTISSFYYSFTSWDGINPNIKFIGFDNYKEIFTNARFGNALKNTALLTVVISICENALALGLALLVDNVIKGKICSVPSFTCRSFFRASFPALSGRSCTATTSAPSTRCWI